MGKFKITDFYLYRWRYALGFAAIGISLVSILFMVGFFVPNGLSKSEMASTVTSVQTPPNVIRGLASENLVHLPYHVLQKLSVQVFGFNQFAIKLPSLIMGFASILLLYGVIRLWFRRNTAIVTSLIAVTSGQFLLQAQLGTPGSSYLFWSAALLFFTSILARSEKYKPVWLVGAAVVAALSLYSPLMIYGVAALSITCIFHPHARFVVFRQSPLVLLLSAVIFLLLVAPLIIGLFSSPRIALQLLGIPNSLSLLSWNHLTELLAQYVGFAQPTNGETIRPAYSLAILLIALIGAVRLFTAKYTAKSYILSLWFLFVMAAIAINNDVVAFTFVPVMLLVAFGTNYLIRSWYVLFPHNPYARVAGLLPLSVLVFGIAFSGVERFVNGYHYDPQAQSTFSKDLSFVNDEIKKSDSTSITLIVPASQKQFYTLYSARVPNAKNVTVLSDINLVTASQKIATSLVISNVGPLPTTAAPSSIRTSGTSQNANRLYLYKTAAL